MKSSWQMPQLFYGWKLVILLFFAMAVNTALPIYGLGILNVHMGDELGFNRATLGVAFAVYMLMTGLPGPLAAKLIERFGVRWTLVIGNVVLSTGALAMATIVRTPALLILFAGVALGSASALGGPVPIQALVTRWFARRRTLAMGIVISGGSIAGIVSPPLLEGIVDTSGWRAGWWLIAGFTVAIIVGVLLFVRERPEDVGQQLDGGAPATVDRQDRAAAPAPLVYQTDEDWYFRDVLRTPSFWLLIICSVGVSAVYTVFFAQAVLQMRDLGYSAQTASYFLSLAISFGFAAHITISLVGDRIDPKGLWVGSLLLQGIGIGLFARGDQPLLLYVAIFCLGVGNAASILCLIMTLGNWFGERASPFVFGFGSAFSAACGALAPVVSGYCYDRTGTFAPAFYGISLLCVVGAGALWLVRPPRLKTVVAMLA